MENKGTCEKHGEFNLLEGCQGCLSEKKVSVVIKVKAPEDLLEGEEEKVVGEIVKLVDAVAEITGAPKPEITAITAVINIRPDLDAAIQLLAAEAHSLLTYAEARIINTNEDLKAATDDLALISKARKALNKQKTEWVGPIKVRLDEVNAAFASILEPLTEADLITRDKYTAFREEQARFVAEAEAIEAEKLVLAQREAAMKGGEITVELGTLEVPPEAPRRVYTESGSVTTRKNRKWAIEDFALVPDMYKSPNAGEITRQVKAGIGAIPGIRIYIEEGIQVNTK